jgi:hypothetical protein
MWILVSGKVVSNHFHGQWLSKENTIHPATSQQHTLGGWLFPHYVLETIKTVCKIKIEGAHILQRQNSLIHTTRNRWSVITGHIRISVNLYMSDRKPKEGLFTSIPLACIHLHIPHYCILTEPFLELNPFGSLHVLDVSLSHCSDSHIALNIPILTDTFLPSQSFQHSHEA